jgi:hypothetical protein
LIISGRVPKTTRIFFFDSTLKVFTLKEG